MQIIYTCPKCGADLEDIALTSNPPRYMKKCKNIKCDWMYVENPQEVIRLPYVVPDNQGGGVDNVPKCCRYCSNHPSNGGSGICNCVLPYMTQTGYLTSTVMTTSNIGVAENSSDVEFPKEDQMG